MANKTVTAETAGGVVVDANLLRTVQSGVSVKTTFTQIKTWIQGWIETYLSGLSPANTTVSATLSVNLAGKSYFTFAPASATIISAWTNVIPGKFYYIKADVGNSNVSINNDNSYLIGAVANKIVLAAGAGVLFIGENTTAMRQVTVPTVSA